MATTSRLSKEVRREQLLDAALAIVRTRGADGLTLVTLAEAAGVSRPIVYDHFGTRAGLLIALYRQLDDRHRAALDEALRTAEPTVAATARVMSSAYFACATDIPEFAALSAALKGNPDMEATQHDLLNNYTTAMAAALAPYCALSPKALKLHCIALLGAAEAIATELTHRRTTRQQATATFTNLITGTLVR